MASKTKQRKTNTPEENAFIRWRNRLKKQGYDIKKENNLFAKPKNNKPKKQEKKEELDLWDLFKSKK